MDSFTCSRQIVMEIAEYQGIKTKGFDNEYSNTITYITEQPEFFGYETFMTKLSNFISGKLHVHSGNFIVPFKLRMKKYKQGKDWKLI